MIYYNFTINIKFQYEIGDAWIFVDSIKFLGEQTEMETYSILCDFESNI